MLKVVGGKLWKKKNISTWYIHYHADITKKKPTISPNHHHFYFTKSWRKSEVLKILHYTVGIHVVKVIIGEEDTWIELLKKYKVGDCAPLNVIKWNFYEAFELIKVFTFWHKNEHLMFPFPLFITTHWLKIVDAGGELVLIYILIVKNACIPPC